MGDSAELKKLVTPEEIREWLQERFGINKDATVRSIIDLVPAKHRTLIFDAVLDHSFNECAWMVREAMRVYAKDYAVINFSANTTAEEQLLTYMATHKKHFVHLSKDQPLYIAYTPSDEYGKQDRRVKTTVGRYLKKFWPDMDDLTVRRLTDAFRYRYGVEDVKFATTLEEMVRVYVEGPHSCMSYPLEGSNDRLGSHVHPLAAYEVPWLKVAYLERDKRVNARCLIYENPENPDDRRYIRPYGDEILRMKLENMGYRQGNLENVLLKKIPAQRTDGVPLWETFVMPYLDDQVQEGYSAQGVVEDKEYMRVVRRDKVEKNYWVASRTNGLIGLNCEYLRGHGSAWTVRGNPPARDIPATCPCCGTEHLESSMQYVQSENTYVCRECVSTGFINAYTDRRGSTGLVRTDRTITISGLGTVMNDQALIEQLGYAKLDSEYYGDVGYESISETRVVDGRRIRRVDAVYDWNDDLVYAPRAVEIGTAYVSLDDNWLAITPLRVYRKTRELVLSWDYVEDSRMTDLETFLASVAVNTEPADRAAAINDMLDVLPEVHAKLMRTLEELLATDEYSHVRDQAAQTSLELPIAA